MNFELTAEQKLWQEKARNFAQSEVVPFAREFDEKGALPKHLISKMGELGLLSGPIPKAYGGAEIDFVSYALINEEIGKVCSSTRGLLAVQVSLVGCSIMDWGSDYQKKEYLSKIVSGEILTCFALTEPDAGSDITSMKSVATKKGDYYIINGTKHWITNGNISDICLIFAYSNPEAKHKGITAFLVNTDTRGFISKKMEGRALGHCASDHARIDLKNLKVHKRNVLGKENEGFKVAMSSLNYGRLSVAAGALGLAQACLDSTIRFVQERIQFNRPISQFQLIEATIAEIFVEVEAARLMVYKAAEQKDRGINNILETSMAKFYATEVAAKVADIAVQLHGSYGYSNINSVERFFRDIKGYQIFEGTNQIQKRIIGRMVLKNKL